MLLHGYLADVKGLVISEIRIWLSARRYQAVLYDRMLNYPLREGKGLRPAVCIATARALGGRLEDVLPTAAVIELYHNAFLIHDDVEDGSLLRRGGPTLHTEYSLPVAINIGDAMLALCMQPLMANTRFLGLGRALKIQDYIARMALESAEGQALELEWVRQNEWQLRDADYWHLVFKKTCWYSFIAPMLIGAIAAGASKEFLGRLRKFAGYLGVSFQIQDDLLNLEADQGAYGKEIDGDLVEGKRTLILLHAMRCASESERAEAERIFRKPLGEKTIEDLRFVRTLINRTGALTHARRVARDIGAKAAAALHSVASSMTPSVHVDFLHELVAYVTDRNR